MKNILTISLVTSAIATSSALADDFSQYPQASFTKLKCALGEYQSMENSASISKLSVDKKPGSLKLHGGDDKYIDLSFNEKVQANQITSISFKLKRLSKAKHSKVVIAVKQGDEWRQLMRSFKVPTDKFSDKLEFKLEGSDYRTLRFSSATPDDGGFLIDDLVIETKGDRSPQDTNPAPAPDAKNLQKEMLDLVVREDDTLTQVVIMTTDTQHEHVINYSLLINDKIISNNKTGDFQIFEINEKLKAGKYKITLQANLKKTAPIDFKLVAELSSTTLKEAGQHFPGL